MTIEQIIEGNRLIAEFMGGRPFYSDRTCTEVVAYFGIHDKPAQTYFDDLEYHSSWDWLMPVINKLPKDQSTMAYCDNLFDNMSDGFFECDIDKVWLAVVNFIKWYNQ